jgi:hypothetical protein
MLLPVRLPPSKSRPSLNIGSGRVKHDTLIDPSGAPVEVHRATQYSSRDVPYAPDEVLFRRQGAPIRFEENDIYYAHERELPTEQRVLPDSDLLKAIHSYASQFYDRTTAKRQRQHKAAWRRVRPAQAYRLGANRVNSSMAKKISRREGSNDGPMGHRLSHIRRDGLSMHRDGRNDERSMDETALIAFGILLEEAGKEVLGQNGDLVFTEADMDLPDAVAAAGHDGGAGNDMELDHDDDLAMPEHKKRKLENHASP